MIIREFKREIDWKERIINVQGSIVSGLGDVTETQIFKIFGIRIFKVKKVETNKGKLEGNFIPNNSIGY